MTDLQASNFQTIEPVESNVTSVTNGNELIGNVSKVVSCVLAQANKFPKLDQRIEERNIQDANRWK